RLQDTASSPADHQAVTATTDAGHEQPDGVVRPARTGQASGSEPVTGQASGSEPVTTAAEPPSVAAPRPDAHQSLMGDLLEKVGASNVVDQAVRGELTSGPEGAGGVHTDQNGMPTGPATRP